MFTGIIEEKGKIKSIFYHGGSLKISVSAKTVCSDLAPGDSIAVNGVCLTVTDRTSSYFSADVSGETLKRSSLADISAGCLINLERAMKMSSRFGGHFVSGHIDGTGQIYSIVKKDNSYIYTIKCGPEILKFIVLKGSVAVDGISLTISALGSSCFSVCVIPHTMSLTNLQNKKNGDIVNIECDLIGKYISRILEISQAEDRKSKACETNSIFKIFGFAE